MSAPTSIYRRAFAAGALRQGEIVSNVLEARLRLETIYASPPVVDYTRHEYAVVVSQDCDLDWDWNARMSGDKQDKLLSGILFCEAKPADRLAYERGYNRRERNLLRQNRDERYQFLQKVDFESDLQENGVPELVVDFKRYFSLSAEEADFRLENKELQRRCLFEYPYLQHLITRFWNFQGRVALPEQHLSERYIPPEQTE